MTPQFRNIETNGVTLRAAIVGEGPLIVLVHGFPDSWYSWRHQMPALAAAGFQACAVSVRGYHGSSQPHEIEAYAVDQMTADIAGVIDALSPDAPAILIGHDWGAMIVYATALMYPRKVRAVAGMSVPYPGNPPAPLNQILKVMFADQGKFFYMNYFQDEGVAEAELERDVRATIRKVFFGASGDGAGWTAPDKKHGDPLLEGMADPATFPAWLSDADMDHYVEEFKQSGFRGPINRYRNGERDWAAMNRLQDRVIRQPTLFIAGERDLVLKMFGGDPIARMRENTADLRAVHLIPAVGHWVQQEAPEQTTQFLIDWLATI